MQIGMIGLGRMGANMVRRLLRAQHECVVYDRNPEAVKSLATEGAVGAESLDDFVAKLKPQRAIWLMIPAALVDATLHDLVEVVSAGDIIIDGGNSYYIDDIRRAAELKAKGIHYVDVGTSGGVWGRERGYCQMIGGENEVVTHLDPIFKALAPGSSTVPPTPGRKTDSSTAAEGYLHCGPAGAGHFVKMVHNGIEYGLMAAYAEGLNVLHHANEGKAERAADAETSPLRNPEHYRYDFNIADITELWRRGSVVASWLLDLTANAFAQHPNLEGYSGHVADSGEGRWTINAAVEEGVPVPVLSAALFQRFDSRGEAEFANKILSAMRFQFGGHVERGAQ
ncbi:MAG TPA: decarboxylating 6-phosphogluconate dehydrogenase [Pyrinomonadaceae bacterium]|nr:decarboxylating 6-phosphogluconate dehydrogenase [Pyrinomonadaceae bacterium]